VSGDWADGLFDKWPLLLESSAEVMAEAEAAAEGREITARLLMLSGGDDSTAVAHHYRGRADAVVHLNTGIGVRQTREFVRDTVAAWGLPLIECGPRPGKTYRDLVLGNVLAARKSTGPLRPVWEGFPVASAHDIMYFYLKETPLREVCQRFITHPRKQRVMLITGLRRPESRRRRARAAVRVDDRSRIWASPMIYWDKADLNEYRRRNPDCPRNEVAANLHRSGECYCGSYSLPGDLAELEFFYPEAAAEIRALEAEAKAAGIPRCDWEAQPRGPATRGGELCASCNVQADLFDGG
jgi:3'-phosphoadenosine 5'-phosphosulfate sulfotransferase (PAPS reductase)/FAD synthetase